MKKFLISISLIIVLSSAAVVAYLLFTGPRMKIQPHIRQYQMKFPDVPPEIIPMQKPFELLSPKEEIQNLKNPVAETPENISKGKIYYDYYCLSCHGEKGNGFGPVGFSYNPVPANLRTEKIKSMPDGQLLYAMLKGTGHDPMLEKIVLPQYRWHLVVYLRHLNSLPPLPAESVLGPNSLP